MNKQEKEIYENIAENQKWCQLCGSTSTLHIHHVRYGAVGRKTYEGNLIRLCNKCHNLVHSNKKKYQPILLEIIGAKD